jgi:hypothetical protein
MKVMCPACVYEFETKEARYTLNRMFSAQASGDGHTVPASWLSALQEERQRNEKALAHQHGEPDNFKRSR